MIYLDYNATTPIAPEIAEAMMPYILSEFGNPSSSYSPGIKAKGAVEKARSQVAGLLGCNQSEIVFTGSGSESNNMVLKCVAQSLISKGRHIITTKIEHPAILNPALYLMENGWDVTFLPVDGNCLVDPEDVKNAIRKDTILISVMHANNETGTIQPIREIGLIAQQEGILFHTDAAQTAGKIETDVKRLNVDFLTVAGHKLYAPKGVGALYIRNGIEIEPFIHGGGQEMGRRSGTENVIFNAGLGAACELAAERLRDDIKKITGLRNRLQDKIIEGIPDVVLNGHQNKRLCNTINLSFPGVIGSEVLEKISELCASTGAACHDRSVTISHVLVAMGVSREIGTGAVRLTLGRPTTKDEVDQAARWIVQGVKEKML